MSDNQDALFDVEAVAPKAHSGNQEPTRRQSRPLPKSGVSWQRVRLKPPPLCHICQERAVLVSGVPSHYITHAYFQRTDKSGTTYWCGPHGADQKTLEQIKERQAKGHRKGKKR